MKKISLVFLLLFSSFLLVACGEEKEEEPVVVLPTTYTVTFNSDGGSAVVSQEVVEGEFLVDPSDPTKEMYNFMNWFETEGVVFDMTSPVMSDINLSALWELDLENLTDEAKVNFDIIEYEAMMLENDYFVNTPYKIQTYNTRISYDIDSPYISEHGVILPTPDDETLTSGTLTAVFTLNDVEVTKVYNIPLMNYKEVVIENVVVLPFENLTTEYVVEDGEANIYYEENGTVPYIKVVDFFSLLQGFVDVELDMTFTNTDGVLEISYQYYDEDDDETYDMILTVDSIENTIVVNDPAFYWAYVTTTETNYGRHIDYDMDNPLSHTDEGSDVVYDLDDYNMDIVVYEDEVVLPFYMANQLLAGLSYFNVFYNTDGLYGIYSLPADGSRELNTITNSSMNGKSIPADLLVHTYNMLAFDLDNLYGLKDIMEVDTYYDLLDSQLDVFLNPDAEDLDYAIRDLLLLDLDEPHTSYGYHSYFNKPTFNGPPVNSLSNYGSRFTQWYYDGYVAVDNVITEKWNVPEGPGWAASSPNRPYYWFLDDVTVMLSLDDFYTADIDESATFDITVPEKILELDDASGLLPVITEGNKFFYYNQSTETAKLLEILVKGVDEAYVDTYAAALVAAGFTYVPKEDDSNNLQLDYYTITLNDGTEDVDYMVSIDFDAEYDLFWLGLIDFVPTTTGAIDLVIDVEELVGSDSAVYLEMMLEQIMEERPLLEDIILDLSWNTGGNVGALYRIVGFITDESFRVSGIDGDTGGASSYYVTIPGIDAYDELEWSLLITPVTFSAANSLATIFMENDLGSIIGVTSGGGACSITPILLPNGTAFTTSSNNIGAYRTGEGTTSDPYVYHNTEFGIDPDYPIDVTDIYNASILLDILATD